MINLLAAAILLPMSVAPLTWEKTLARLEYLAENDPFSNEYVFVSVSAFWDATSDPDFQPWMASETIQCEISVSTGADKIIQQFSAPIGNGPSYVTLNNMIQLGGTAWGSRAIIWPKTIYGPNGESVDVFAPAIVHIRAVGNGSLEDELPLNFSIVK